MFVRTKSTPNSPRKSVQLVKSVRVGDKVKQKIIRHIGIANNEAELIQLQEIAEYLKAKLEAEHQLDLFSPEEVASQVIEAKKERANKQLDASPLTVNLKDLKEVQRNILGIHEVYGEIYNQLGFDSIWGNRKSQQTKHNLLRHITMARIAQPASKRASVALLERDFGIRLNLNKVYKMLDSIDDKAIREIQDCSYNNATDLFGGKLDVLFYDCTTLYFESFIADDLRRQGYSKDHKSQETQVLLALLVTKEGLPIGYEVFPGAQVEGSTLIPILEQLQEKYKLDRVVFVADRGLFSQKNLEALEQAKIDYIVGAKLKVQSKAIKEQILNLEAYQPLNEELKYLTISKDNDRLLIATHSQRRACKDSHDRDKALKKLQKKLDKSKNPKEFIAASNYKKYINIPDTGPIHLNPTAIKDSARWDGIAGVITNIKDVNITEVLNHYSSLWQVEESFRIQKHDLKVRPIYHWTESRIRAHLAISFMSLCCVRHLEYRVKLQYQKLSPEVIRKELCHVQVSILENQKTKATYAMPSSVSPHAAKIYQVIGKKPTTTAYQII